MQFDYTVTTSKSFIEAVAEIEIRIAKAGMRVLHVHDVQQNLKEKSFEFAPFKIIEFCNAKYAHEFLSKNLKIGLCMPCKINVYVQNGQTVISGMRPIVLAQFFPELDLGDRPAEIDALVRTIIDESK